MPGLVVVTTKVAELKFHLAIVGKVLILDTEHYLLMIVFLRALSCHFDENCAGPFISYV